MSLSHLSLPSISRVLEAEHGFIPRNPSTRLGQPEASMIFTCAPSSLSPSPSSHLMKTIDFRDTTLEDEEEEQFSFIVGFPDEPASDEADTQTIFNEGGVANFTGLHGEIQGQGSTSWFRRNFSVLVTAVRKLLPVKIAEVLLRKAVHHQ